MVTQISEDQFDNERSDGFVLSDDFLAIQDLAVLLDHMPTQQEMDSAGLTKAEEPARS